VARPLRKIPVLWKCRWWQDLGPKCKAEGKPERTLQLYDNNANCIQPFSPAVGHLCQRRQHGDQAVKANPDKLEKAIAVTIPYSVGIAVPKTKPEFRDAVMAALIEVQKPASNMTFSEVGARRQQLQGPDILTAD